mgnify:CR=1 FL=1
MPSKPRFQRNHLNQTAAYGSVIKRADGKVHYLSRPAHRRFHDKLNEYWKMWKAAKIIPTNRMYHDALKDALRAAIKDKRLVAQLAKIAREERHAAKLWDHMPVPRIPGRP